MIQKTIIESRYKTGSIRMFNGDINNKWFIIVESYVVFDFDDVIYTIKNLTNGSLSTITEIEMNNKTSGVTTKNYGVKKNGKSNNRNNRSE